ncbi:uncharacterized protein LOC125832865 [Solanum verrucosum]|uniref:uncharacterized protein LOC125832865 n=1 Tax=Solanum verrucosum TaxID=315347 RepID=UPI0020D1B262|nr:uncharacterized protein LOC125832865 [Solanum verrucosum]
MDLRLRDFIRMNPPMFFDSKVGEDPQEFLAEVYKIIDAMGVTFIEKAELAAYQFKDVAEVWYTQWKNNRPVEAGHIDWEVFKKAFLDRFFHQDKREAKVEEFINLRQGGMTVQEYFLKFTKLSKYAPSLMSNPRDEMCQFVIVDESRLRKKNREVKRARSYEGNSSKGKFEGQGRASFKRRFSNKGFSSALRDNKDRASNPKTQGGNSGGSSMVRPTCAKFGKKHDDKCLVSTEGCYSCRNSGHLMRDCLMLKVQGREGKKVPPSC